jgi:hypothetical protein
VCLSLSLSSSALSFDGDYVQQCRSDGMQYAPHTRTGDGVDRTELALILCVSDEWQRALSVFKCSSLQATNTEPVRSGTVDGGA